MADPPFLSQEQFAQLALEIVANSYGDKFNFELDVDNFCILFRNKDNPDNVGKMYLQNRYQCMQTYGREITMEKVREIINDSTDGLTFYSQPAMTVGQKDLAQLFPMVKTPQWFSSYQETMTSHGCRETIFQVPVDDSQIVSMTLALNYGKFRRYVTQEEVAEWRQAFDIDPVKEAKKNLKARFSADGAVKKEWDNPAASGVVWRAQLPDELSASLIVLPENINKFKVKGDPVAIFPVASVLYVTGSKDEEGLRVMVDLALEYLNYPHFLTLQPLRLSPKMELSGKNWVWSTFESSVVMEKLKARNYEAGLSAEKAAPSQRRPLSVASGGGVSVSVSVQDLLQEDGNEEKRGELKKDEASSDVAASATVREAEMKPSAANAAENERVTISNVSVSDDSWVVADGSNLEIERSTTNFSATVSTDNAEVVTSMMVPMVDELPPPPPNVPPPPLTPPPPRSQLAPLCDGEVLPKDIEAELVDAALEEDDEEMAFESTLDRDIISLDMHNGVGPSLELEMANMGAVARAFASDEKHVVEAKSVDFEVLGKQIVEEALSVSVKDVVAVEGEKVIDASPKAQLEVVEELKTVEQSGGRALPEPSSAEATVTENVIDETGVNASELKLEDNSTDGAKRLEKRERKKSEKSKEEGNVKRERKKSEKSKEEANEKRERKKSEKSKEDSNEKDVDKIEVRAKEKRDRKKSMSDGEKGNEFKKEKKKEKKSKVKEIKGEMDDITEPIPVRTNVNAPEGEPLTLENPRTEVAKTENEGLTPAQFQTFAEATWTDVTSLDGSPTDVAMLPQVITVPEFEALTASSRAKSDIATPKDEALVPTQVLSDVAPVEYEASMSTEILAPATGDEAVMPTQVPIDIAAPKNEVPKPKPCDVKSETKHQSKEKQLKELGLSHKNIWFDAQKYENAYIEHVKQSLERDQRRSSGSSILDPSMSEAKPVEELETGESLQKEDVAPSDVAPLEYEASIPTEIPATGDVALMPTQETSDITSSKNEVPKRKSCDVKSEMKHQSNEKQLKELGLSHENIWFDAQKYESAYITHVKQSLERDQDKSGGPPIVEASISEVKPVEKFESGESVEKKDVLQKHEKNIINPFYVKDQVVDVAVSKNNQSMGLAQENIWFDQIQYEEALVQQQLCLMKLNETVKSKSPSEKCVEDSKEREKIVNKPNENLSDKTQQEELIATVTENADNKVEASPLAKEKDASLNIPVKAEKSMTPGHNAPPQEALSPQGDNPKMKLGKDTTQMQTQQHILNRKLPLPQLFPLTAEERENIHKHERVQTCRNISHQLKNEFVRATDHASSIKTELEKSNESAVSLLAQIKSRKTSSKILPHPETTKDAAAEIPVVQEVPAQFAEEVVNVVPIVASGSQEEAITEFPEKVVDEVPARIPVHTNEKISTKVSVDAPSHVVTEGPADLLKKVVGEVSAEASKEEAAVVINEVSKKIIGDVSAEVLTQMTKETSAEVTMGVSIADVVKPKRKDSKAKEKRSRKKSEKSTSEVVPIDVIKEASTTLAVSHEIARSEAVEPSTMDQAEVAREVPDVVPIVPSDSQEEAIAEFPAKVVDEVPTCIPVRTNEEISTKVAVDAPSHVVTEASADLLEKVVGEVSAEASKEEAAVAINEVSKKIVADVSAEVLTQLTKEASAEVTMDVSIADVQKPKRKDSKAKEKRSRKKSEKSTSEVVPIDVIKEASTTLAVSHEIARAEAVKPSTMDQAEVAREVPDVVPIVPSSSQEEAIAEFPAKVMDEVPACIPVHTNEEISTKVAVDAPSHVVTEASADLLEEVVGEVSAEASKEEAAVVINKVSKKIVTDVSAEVLTQLTEEASAGVAADVEKPKKKDSKAKERRARQKSERSTSETENTDVKDKKGFNKKSESKKSDRNEKKKRDSKDSSSMECQVQPDLAQNETLDVKNVIEAKTDVLPKGLTSTTQDNTNKPGVKETAGKDLEAFDFFAAVPLAEKKEMELSAEINLSCSQILENVTSEVKAPKESVVKEIADEDLEAFDFFTAVPLGSAAVEAEKKEMELSAEMNISCSKILENVTLEVKAPKEPVVKEIADEDLAAFDFFSAVPLGIAAVEAEKKEMDLSAEKNLSYSQIAENVTLEVKAPKEPVVKEIADEDLDAFDFFTAVPLGSAAVEAEKKEMEQSAEMNLSYRQIAENVTLEVEIPKENTTNGQNIVMPLIVNVESQDSSKTWNLESVQQAETLGDADHNHKVVEITLTDSADSQFELYKDVKEMPVEIIPKDVQTNLIAATLNDDEIEFSEQFHSQPLSKAYKKKSFSKSEGELLDDFQGISRPPSLLEFDDHEGDGLTSASKRSMIMKSSGSVLESFDETEEQLIEGENKSSSQSEKKKRYGKGARRHTEEMKLVKNKLTIIELEETVDSLENEYDDDVYYEDEQPQIEADIKVDDDVLKIESAMKNVFTTSEILPPVPDEDKVTFSFAEIAKGSRLRKRSESMCSLDADPATDVSTVVLNDEIESTSMTDDPVAKENEVIHESNMDLTPDDIGTIDKQTGDILPVSTAVTDQEECISTTDVTLEKENEVVCESNVNLIPDGTVTIQTSDILEITSATSTSEDMVAEMLQRSSEQRTTMVQESSIITESIEVELSVTESPIQEITQEKDIVVDEIQVSQLVDTKVDILKDDYKKSRKVNMPEVEIGQIPQDTPSKEEIPDADVTMEVEIVGDDGESNQDAEQMHDISVPPTALDKEAQHILNRALPVPTQPELTAEEISNIKKHKKVTAVKNVSQQLQNEFVRATEHAQTIKSLVEESNASAESLLAQVKSKNEDGEVKSKKKRKRKSEEVVEAPVPTLSPVPKQSTSEIVDPWKEGPIVLDKEHLQLLGLTHLAWDAMQGLHHHDPSEEEKPGACSLHLDTTFICFNCGMDAVERKMKLMKCKRCMIASYCGKDCQKSNWIKHKKVCKCVGIRRAKGENEPLKILL